MLHAEMLTASAAIVEMEFFQRNGSGYGGATLVLLPVAAIPGRAYLPKRLEGGPLLNERRTSLKLI